MKAFGRFIRGKGFETIFTLLAAGSIFYVSNRMGQLTVSLFQVNCSVLVACILIFIMGYMLLYMKCKKEFKSTRNFYECCSVFMCFLLYLVLFLWGYDLLRLLFHWEGGSNYGIPVILSIGVTVYGFFHAKKLYVKQYDVQMEGAKDEKLVLLSDIHVGTFVNASQLEKIVEKVNALNPDWICIAGDLFDVDAFVYCDQEKIAGTLRKLQAKKDMFAILGNHDPASKLGVMRTFYEKTNIRLLIDEMYESDGILFVGRDDVTTNPNRQSLEEMLSKGTRHLPTIVMDHNPLGILEATKEKCNCILCGHTHKGQFFPANIFTKLAYGKTGFYGYGITDQTNSIVSSGAGYFQMPMRVGSNSEIVVVQLKGRNANEKV